jgi:hypothetical protein
MGSELGSGGVPQRRSVNCPFLMSKKTVYVVLEPVSMTQNTLPAGSLGLKALTVAVGQVSATGTARPAAKSAASPLACTDFLFLIFIDFPPVRSGTLHDASARV